MAKFGQKISNFFHKPLVSGALHGYNLTGFHPVAQIGQYLLDHSGGQKKPPQMQPQPYIAPNPQPQGGGFSPSPSPYGAGGPTPPPMGPQGGGAPQDDGFGSALSKINSQFALPNSPYDVSNYVKDYNKGVDPGETELLSEYDQLNNRRNDIFTGTVDPYGVGVRTGRALNPSQLNQVEEGMGRTYDPALSDVKARLLHSQEMQRLNASKSGGSGSNQMTDNERAAQQMFQSNQIVKDYNTIIGQKNTIDNLIAGGSSGPSDVASIFTFMKALDPNSVVRESEYDTAARSGNLFKGVYAKFNGYFKENGGILPPALQKEFQAIIDRKLQGQTALYRNFAEQQKEIARRQGLNPDNVVIDFGGGLQPQNSGGGYQQQAPIQNPYAGQDYLSYYDYNTDIALARQAVQSGAPAASVIARLKQKYAQVNPADINFSNVGGDTNTAMNIQIPQSSRLAYVNNNPGNIKFANQPGAVMGQNGFARFSSPQAGFNAIIALTDSYARRGHTLSSYINKYAPSFENNTQAYIASLYRQTGISPNTPLSSLTQQQKIALARAIAVQESSTRFA